MSNASVATACVNKLMFLQTHIRELLTQSTLLIISISRMNSFIAFARHIYRS